MNNKLITGIVGLAIIVVLCGSMLVPIIDGFSNDQKESGTNEVGTYTVMVTNEPVTIALNSSSGGLIINGEEQTQPYIQNNEKIWVNGACAWIYYNEGTSTYYLQGLGDTGGSPVVLTGISFDGATVTFTTSSGSTEYTSDFIVYPDINGNYTQTQVNSDALKAMHFNKDSALYFGYLGGHYALLKYQNETVSQIGGKTISANTIDLTIDPVTLPDNSLQLQISPIIEQDGSPSTFWAAYVPLEYTYYTSSGSAIWGIMYAMPIIILIAALMAAVPILKTKY